MKKKSVLFLILGLFWISYVIFGFVFNSFGMMKDYDSDVLRRKKIILYQLDNASHYLLAENAKSLIPRLQTARELGQFDFFILKQKDQVIGFYNKENKLELINWDYKITDDFTDTEDFSFKTQAIYDYKLTIGINKNKAQFLMNQFWLLRYLILQDLALVSLIVFLIAYLVLKDILNISKILQSADRKSIKNIRAHSKEAETLLLAATGFDQTNQNLKLDNLLLASTLAPAIKAEIQTGKQTPYAVPCTVARIDLNGYTQMFLHKDTASLLHILNEYFKNSRDIIERYGGSAYQYIGDEVVCIFKSDLPSHSAKMALAAVRTLFQAAEKITTPAISQGLRLKASLSTGELHFIKLDGGYSFSGLPLIETVRMLGQVSEKTESRLIVFDESLTDIITLCQPLTTRTTVFKGFDHESHLIEVKEFKAIDEALQTLPIHEIAQYFRGDHDLAGILAALKQHLLMRNLDSFHQLCGPLTDFYMSEPSKEVLIAYKDLLNECLKESLHQVEESRFLSTTISLSHNLLRPEQIDSELKEAFDLCEEAKDPRTSANTLFIKSKFNLPGINLEEKFNSPYHRLAGQALLLSGQTQVTKKISQNIIKLMTSTDPKQITTGLYVMKELYDHHFKKDAVYVKINPHFQELAKVLPKLCAHADFDVRNLAALSLKTVSGVDDDKK